MINRMNYREAFMRTEPRKVDRITISLPHGTAHAADELSIKLKISRSEIYAVAMERFLAEQRRESLQTIAAEMAEEYRTDRNLTDLTVLDGEDFA
jgi:metal-responsive CopG/Arc/MetJ family transcriptional regulator